MHREFLSRVLGLAAALCLVAAAPAGAVLLYTTDVDTDELVRIDSSTGTATVIGSLGAAASDVDLALTPDGRLWGLNSVFGSRVDLWEIDKLTGAVLTSVQVFAGGNPVQSAEALATRGSGLKIAYSPSGDANSATLGDLSLAGVVTNPIAADGDIDGLGNGNSNAPDLFRFDREPGLHTRLYGLDADTGVSTLIGQYSDALGFHDATAVPGVVFTVDSFAPNLYEIDAITGAILNTVALSRSGSYFGLALAEAGDVVPAAAPSGAALLALGALAAFGRRRALRPA